MSEYGKQVALVTGANSGLGFEAAAQLAELGYGSVTLACRTQDKADAAAKELRERTGADVFDTLVVDVGVIESSRKAAAELVARGRSFDVVLLNTGMVPSRLDRTDDGIEMCFASSLVGHHIITTELLEAGLLDRRVRRTRRFRGRQQRHAEDDGHVRLRLRPRRAIRIRHHRCRGDEELRHRVGPGGATTASASTRPPRCSRPGGPPQWPDDTRDRPGSTPSRPVPTWGQQPTGT